MIKLDTRLKTILNEIHNAETLADIGCDHGKLIVSAILSGRAKKGIAVDISADSLKKTKILAERYNVEDKIDCLTGDGFLPIKNEVSVAVIAGLGARETAKILSGKDIASKYILVPHQDTPVLRRYLMENSFFVDKDFTVKEGRHYYSVIVARKGSNNYSDAEIYLGKNIPESPYFDAWLDNRYDTLKKIIEKAGGNAVAGDLYKEWEVIRQWQD
ncbi:MAG TPA: class I SAM-dependent methyltransferase [Clostridia bacterium]|jgi:tRNA (adenine22-N1)-methyltransferase|nr:class I SAM-dependent methyltransferase [Clostridia bacterium]